MQKTLSDISGAYYTKYLKSNKGFRELGGIAAIENAV
tara:strand:- start:427 stop:537 length:111 start_codon:yes stop_codon:yes gene_type:complete